MSSGMHFFSPANIMRLLEVVRGAKSAKDVVATAMGLAKRIGKIAVLAGVCDGFIGNRMVAVLRRRGQALALEGATPAQIDKAITDWGARHGALRDERSRRDRCRLAHPPGAPATPNEQKMRYAVNDKIAELGRFGQKTGAGSTFTRKASARPSPIPRSRRCMPRRRSARASRGAQIGPRKSSSACCSSSSNTGAEILEEGIALRASDIDTVYVNGYGFPAWRGGPMWSVDAIGLKTVVEKMQRL